MLKGHGDSMPVANTPRARRELVMRRWKIATLLAVWAGLPALISLHLLRPPAAAAADAVTPPDCTLTQEAGAEPRSARPGEPVRVRLHLRFDCGPDPARPVITGLNSLHFVLVLDASGSMAGDPNRVMKDAAKKLVDRFDLTHNPGVKVGVVEYASTARTLCSLTNKASQAKSCISVIGANGGTCIDCGIREGLSVLDRGRRGAQGPPSEVMVVLSDGANNAGCEPLRQAGRQARDKGVIILTFCLGTGCDQMCMQSLAHRPDLFTEADLAAMPAAFERILGALGHLAVKRVDTSVVLPRGARLDARSVSPPAAEIGPDGAFLAWREGALLPVHGITFTFDVVLPGTGDVAAYREAHSWLVDHHNRRFEASAPAPRVEVSP